MRFQNLLAVCIACLLLVFSCKNRTPGSSQSSTPELDSLLAELDQTEAPAQEPDTHFDSSGEPWTGTPARIILPDDSTYSKNFLNQLSVSGLANEFELVDSLLIVEKQDTFLFPMEISWRQWVNFMAVKDEYTYSLDIAKINFTSLGFNFELRKGNQTIDQLTGLADLSPGFFLGGESDEDNQTGVSYFCNEYVFENQNCSFSIRLGDDAGIWKVKVIKNCVSARYDIALEDCPVLLEKL